MTAYFIRRFLLIIPTFLGITMLVFMITRFVPGGPMEKVLLQGVQSGVEGSGGGALSGDSVGGGSPLSPDQLAQLEAFYGFDKPWYEAYVIWLWDVVQLDLGTSTRYNDDVLDIIVERLPISTYYGIMTLIITYIVCIPLGIMKAIKHNSTFDNISSILTFLGYAVPSYVVAVILLVTAGANLEWFPLGGFMSDDTYDMTILEQAWDILYHSILPLTAYVAGSFAVLTFMMKTSLMENLAADYVRTAIAKGVPFRKAVVKHAIRNSLIPLATHFGQIITVFLGGSFLIEKIFNIDGLGLLGYESIVERDYPVVLGTLVISSLATLVGNILSDVCVALVDPRVQYK
ncbi:ABC transporter permease subunit [bacterium]|nr:ABC transporter permease subunit [bacterium]